MPELPEVETIRSDIAEVAIGSVIEDIVLSGVSLRRPYPVDFADRLRGASITGARRVGKHLLVDLHRAAGVVTKHTVMVFHFGMSGQLWWLQPGEQGPLAHAHVRIFFAQGTEARFVDPRTFGWVDIAELETLEQEIPFLDRLGTDALDCLLDVKLWQSKLLGRRRRLKLVLMDQSIVSGIGNIYSDEILFESKLRWDRPAQTLNSDEVARLAAAVRLVLSEAVAKRGSSLSDAQYRDLFGRPGAYQLQHKVYAKGGEPCSRCGQAIRREKFGARSTFFCPNCQV